MGYCHKCGTELPQVAKYCYKCGAPQGTRSSEEFTVNSEDLVKKIKDLLHEGNVKKIIVRDEHGRVLLEFPVTVGVIGALVAPWLAALGAIAALVNRCTISVERTEYQTLI